MSAPVDQFSPARLPATLKAVRTLSLTAAIVSVGIAAFVLGIESLLPIADGVVVRDGLGLALTVVASWALFVVATRMQSAYPRPTGAFAAILAIIIGLGGVAFILNFVLDVVLVESPGVLALAVPAALVISVVVPGVYLAFAARAIARAATV